MESKKGFWEFVERYKLLIETILALAAVIPIMTAGVVLIATGLNATVPAWLVLVASMATLALGYLVGRGPKVVIGAQKKTIIRREFYSALWEIDQLADKVDGPFCKTCLVRMNLEYDDPDRNSRGNKILAKFVCRNPDCTSRGAITRGLNVTNIDEAQHQVHEQIEAEKRRQETAKKL